MDPILFCSKLIILTAAASKVSWKSRTNLFKRRRKRASRECNKTIRIDFIRMRNIARYAAVVAAVVACTAWPPILLTAFEATMCMPECKANIALHSLSFSSFLFFFFGFPRFYWELGVSAKSVKIAKIHCDDGKWRCRARKSRNYSSAMQNAVTREKSLLLLLLWLILFINWQNTRVKIRYGCVCVAVASSLKIVDSTLQTIRPPIDMAIQLLYMK